MSEPGPISLRAWIGSSPFPWPAAASLPAGALLIAAYSVVSVQRLRTRQDKPYVKLQLADAHGSVEGRIWEDAERVDAWLDAGGYVGVRGRIEIFNRERQLKIEEIVPLRIDTADVDRFLPHAPRDPAAMERELRARVASVGEAGLRALLRKLLDPTSDSGQAFRKAPAAKHNHHACVGGLMEHTLSVTTLCDRIAEHYGGGIDRDLLLTAALLHDLGKTREILLQPGFPYSDEGRLLGHILLGLDMVAEAAAHVPLPAERLLLLQHLIASHQGRYEWQSPREPRILEGLILHYADDLDAKMNQAQALLEAVPDGWTAWSRSFGRDFFRHRPVGQPEEPPADVEPPAPNRSDALDLFGTFPEE